MAKKLSKKALAKKSTNCTYNESSLEPYEELFTELQPPTGLKYEQEATGGVSTAPEEPSQQPWISPYTEAPATLQIGPDKTVYFVPKNFLPAEWFSSGSQKPFCFPDVDIQTGHTLVHYLYKGNYEKPAANDGTTSLHARTKLKAALLVYIAANDRALPGLQLLATSEIEEHGSRLDLIEILDTIDSDFPKLCRDSWVHEYLRRKAMAAFEQDHTVFANEALFRDINDTVLLKFLMQCIFNLYKARLSHVLSTEKEQCHGLERQTQCAQDLLPDTNALALEQKREFIVPLADKVPLEQSCESDVEDVATSEDFC
ncbi:hypothetical protein G6514_003046 [Epicoccum nigrum]|nr:hypothetical protein G6514_003046 [Epicoccum nigrum]